MSKRQLTIKEGTDQYSLFRAFTILTLFVICFGIIWNVHEVKVNRITGYHNRAVACAILKSQIEHLDLQDTHDIALEKVYNDQCAIALIQKLDY